MIEQQDTSAVFDRPTAHGDEGRRRKVTALRNVILLGALLAAAPAAAEDAHHPAAAAPPAAAPAAGGQEGTMGAGAMQPGMMQPGMMSGGMMSGSMMPMMGGAGMPMMMGPMPRMMAPERIEGRVAFLKAELEITQAQEPLWDAFAQVLRANARAMIDMRGAMMPAEDATPGGLLARIDAHEQMLAARLESLRRLKAAIKPLYAAFDDAQKRTADDLIMVGPMAHM